MSKVKSIFGLFIILWGVSVAYPKDIVHLSSSFAAFDLIIDDPSTDLPIAFVSPLYDEPFAPEDAKKDDSQEEEEEERKEKEEKEEREGEKTEKKKRFSSFLLNPIAASALLYDSNLLYLYLSQKSLFLSAYQNPLYILYGNFRC
ncbi:MAG: hypothetical protein NW226_14935 [Microscillaceae bacterium]|nr:hypothetical protein [Microscillaceae bacterium]